MDKSRELYHEEISNLKDFRDKVVNLTIYKEDLDEFSDQYEELVAQAKVITRVSDRLQKKLDNANLKIRDQNDEIKDKNQALENTVDQLTKAKLGKKASLILQVTAISLFAAEQFFIEPLIEDNINFPGFGILVLAVLFFLVKLFESSLENHFMNQEKKKILKQKGRTEEVTPSYMKSQS